jgi:hypothetical protein
MNSVPGPPHCLEIDAGEDDHRRHDHLPVATYCHQCGDVLAGCPALLTASAEFKAEYHPEGNTPVERAHEPLVSALYKCTGDAKGNWPRFLHAVLFAIRVTVSRATGFSPYYLLYAV